MKATRILFVCMGNICRSPMAEAVFADLVRQRGLQDRYQWDSAGTGGWHAGEPADHRTLQVLERHGIAYDGRARAVTPADFDDFDLVVAMDEQNLAGLRRVAAGKEGQVSLLLAWDPKAELREAPDPYYGGMEDFHRLYGLVRSAVTALLDRLEQQTQTQNGS